MQIKFIIGLILLGTGLSAQQTHTFKYRLDYMFESNENFRDSKYQGEHYIPEKFTDQSKNSLVIFPFFSLSADSGFTFIDGNTAVNIQNKDLENNFTIGYFDRYYGYEASVRVMYDKAALKKLDREPLKILDRSCNHYQLFVHKDGEEQDADVVFCIDETNEIDNVSFLIEQENTHVKGLILALSPSDVNSTERIVLKKINKINSTINFDLQKELNDYKARKDSLDKIYNSTGYEETVVEDSAADYYDSYYDDDLMNVPKFCDYNGFYELQFEGENSYSVGSSYLSNLCSYGYYLKKGDEEKFKKFALKEIKTTKKNYIRSGLMPKKDAEIFYEFLKKDLESLQTSEPKTATELAVEAAAEAVESLSDYGYYNTYVSEYQSTYKTITPDTSDFAITSLTEDVESGYWKGIPTYCKKIDSIIPDFSDAELKNHAKNYAGQICDMYLGEFDGASVWYKGTLDAIRAEQLYFNNNRDKLSKQDKELLDEFLNSLD